MASYNLIETVTVGSGGVATIAFTSIPQTYTDLLLVLSGRSLYAENATAIYIRINGDTGLNYSRRRLFGNGSSSGGLTSTDNALTMSAIVTGTTSTALVFGSASIYIPNYTSSNRKSVSTDSATENNGTEAYLHIQGGLWNNTAAITSFSIAGDANFAEFTSASLYGIKNS